MQGTGAGLIVDRGRDRHIHGTRLVPRRRDHIHSTCTPCTSTSAVCMHAQAMIYDWRRFNMNVPLIVDATVRARKSLVRRRLKTGYVRSSARLTISGLLV